MKKLPLSLPFTFSCLALASVAAAQPLVLQNPSFEEPDIAPGTFQGGIPGWQGQGNQGVFNAGEFGQGAMAEDGAQIAFLNDQTGAIWQTLFDNYEAGMTYTLSFSFSARSAPNANDDVVVAFIRGSIFGTADLEADPTKILKAEEFDITDGVLPDTFVRFSVTLSPAEIAAGAAANEPITIGFFGMGNIGSFMNGEMAGMAGTTSDFDVDNVRVEVVPEPGSAALLAAGVVGLLGWRRRA